MINNNYKYRGIKINPNGEEFRETRLIKIIHELYDMLPTDYILMIDSLEDDKGTLIVNWNENPSSFYKNIINSLWMEQNESNIKHYIDYCKCCNSKPQQEDPEIRNYILNYII